MALHLQTAPAHSHSLGTQVLAQDMRSFEKQHVLRRKLLGTLVLLLWLQRKPPPAQEHISSPLQCSLSNCQGGWHPTRLCVRHIVRAQEASRQGALTQPSCVWGSEVSTEAELET